jgi:hypothetical protein
MQEILRSYLDQIKIGGRQVSLDVAKAEDATDPRRSG